MSAPCRKIRLCFVAPNIYPVLSGARDLAVIGGAEFRQSMLARAFHAAGYEVSVVTQDFGQPADDVVDGVRVLKTHQPSAGIPVLRFVHPRLTAVIRRMREAQADIYLQSSASYLTAVVAWHARRAGARSVYSGASDTDFMRGQERVAYARDRWLFRWGLDHVDAIVAQSPRQRELVRQYYWRDASIISGVYMRPQRQRAQRTDLVLWVGGIRQVKRPDRFIALARALPQYRFRMIGGAVGEGAAPRAYYESMRAMAAGVSNLEFLGVRPLDEVEAHFDEARVFVNTSEHEGFPNTFLQAWARGVPTVSYFDAGTSCDGTRPFRWVQDAAGAAAALAALMSDHSAWGDLSRSCAAHFVGCHTATHVEARYTALFRSLGVLPA